MARERKILVTGATGTVGREVVGRLAEAGARVRALTRDPAAAHLPAGVEVVSGSQFAPGALAPLLADVDAVFLVWPRLGDAATARETVRVVARHARRLVFLSSAAVRDGVAEQDDVLGRFHAEIEQAVEGSGIAWTLVRPYAFAANARQWAPAIRAGEPVRVPFPDVPLVPVDERDIAAVAVRALTGDGHAGARHVLTGPQSLTPVGQLRVIGEAVGREIPWEEMPPDAWEREVRGLGLTAGDAAGWRRSIERLRAAPTPVGDTVRRVTGRPARTFREWVAAHAGDFTGPLPRIPRDDAGLVVVSTWTLPDAARQRAAADAALDAWRTAAWPGGMLAHSVLLGTDGRTVLHYSQWTGDAAFDAFQRAEPPTRVRAIDAAVPGIVRNGFTRYRWHRGTPSAGLPVPATIVVERYRAASGEAGRRLADSLARRPPAATGASAAHVHLAHDGGVLVWTEFAGRGAERRPGDASGTAGPQVAQVARYVPHRTVLAPS
jgi:uncharacterized protein YbjT (DUF2867 family)